MLKKQRWENKKYIKWVKTLPCCNPSCTWSYGCDPHHVIGLGGLSGVGMTAPDWASMPLCRLCHTMIHETPEMWPMQIAWIKETIELSDGLFQLPVFDIDNWFSKMNGLSEITMH